MNERIKSLEKRCWDPQTNHLNAEKFAELIVRECAQFIDDKSAARMLMDHFGVE
jgi:hypothetical protein